MKLGDVLEKIVGGGTPSKNRSEFWNGNIPWASVKDINEGQVFLSSTEDTITEEGVKNSSTNIIYKGNVILPTRMGLGRCIINTIDTAINQDLKALYPKKDKLDSKFLLYWLKNNSRLIESMGSGTTVKGIRIEQLTDMNFKELDLYIQQRIAKVLSNYDNLIENNNKRIKILEEMAQKIYKEWFVDFNYPGHETTTFKDTELGKIPSDWEVKTLDNFCNIFTGKKNANAAVNKGMHKFFTCAPDPLSIDTYIYDGKAIIIAGNGSYTGRTQFFDGKFDLYQRTYACTLQEGYDEYLMYTLFMIMKEKFEKKVMGGMHGAAIPYIVYDDIAKYSFAYNDNIFTKFSMMMKIYIESIFLLKKKNIRLKQTRDLLLPRLLSGEIDVDKLKIV